MMKIITTFLLLFMIVISPLYADDGPPLQVAVTGFTAPFVMRGAHQLYGYDVSMITDICQRIHRSCVYKLMPFSDLIPAITNSKADIAISAITITADRSKLVYFSLPYLVSKTQFLGQQKLKDKNINVEFLKKCTIGGMTGTIVADELKNYGVTDPKIVYFPSENDLISALDAGTVDVAFVDEPTATFWHDHSGGKLVALGKSMISGYGLGIAVKDDVTLLSKINQAILQYENSPAFNINYTMYLGSF
jgi:polar amino acid transport system substrate-binding protein